MELIFLKILDHCQAPVFRQTKLLVLVCVRDEKSRVEFCFSLHWVAAWYFRSISAFIASHFSLFFLIYFLLTILSKMTMVMTNLTREKKFQCPPTIFLVSAMKKNDFSLYFSRPVSCLWESVSRNVRSHSEADWTWAKFI